MRASLEIIKLVVLVSSTTQTAIYMRVILKQITIKKGQWENNKANGYGIYYISYDGRYEGGWKDDYQHGVGTEIWPDGLKYVG